MHEEHLSIDELMKAGHDGTLEEVLARVRRPWSLRSVSFVIETML